MFRGLIKTAEPGLNESYTPWGGYDFKSQMPYSAEQIATMNARPLRGNARVDKALSDLRVVSPGIDPARIREAQLNIDNAGLATKAEERVMAQKLNMLRNQEQAALTGEGPFVADKVKRFAALREFVNKLKGKVSGGVDQMGGRIGRGADRIGRAAKGGLKGSEVWLREKPWRGPAVGAAAAGAGLGGYMLYDQYRKNREQLAPVTAA